MQVMIISHIILTFLHQSLISFHWNFHMKRRLGKEMNEVDATKSQYSRIVQNFCPWAYIFFVTGILVFWLFRTFVHMHIFLFQELLYFNANNMSHVMGKPV